MNCVKKILFYLVLFHFQTSALIAQRDSIPINTNWLFKVDSLGIGFSEKWYHAEWKNAQKVSIPHTWNVEKNSEMFYGWGWYQKALLIDAKWKSKKILLEFGAINHTAKFFLNGKFIGEHIGDGFNKFQLKLDSGILFGKSNLLTIAVNNSYNKRKIPFGTSFDWPNDGGLIRKVMMFVENPNAANYLHVEPVLNLSELSGKIKIKIGPYFNDHQSMQIVVSVKEENQSTRQQIIRKKLTPYWQNNEWVADLYLPKIKTWHFDEPNLYKIEVSIRNGNNVVDNLSAVCGFRSFHFVNGEPELNGEKIKLIGVEWTAGSNPNFGFAEPDSVIKRYAGLMKDVNAIFTRQHFQQDDVFYDYCDRNGILVQQELPLWGPETPGTDSIKILANAQLKQMVGNLYNHCSIISWGVGNELRGRDKDIKQLVSGLLSKAHQLDSNRFVTYVSNTLNDSYYNHPGFIPDISSEGDYISMNEYGGSWWKVPENKIHLYLDSVHLSYPNKPLIISEFGLCEPNFSGGDDRRIADLKTHLAIYNSKEYIAGAIYFDLTDYRTHYPGTSENDKYKRRIHGVYDMYGNAKPSMKVLQELSSPIEILTSSTKSNEVVQIKIKGKLGVPQYTAKGYKIYISDSDTNYLKTHSFSLPTIAPGNTVMVELPITFNRKNILVTIVRPTGHVVIQKYLELQ